MLIVRDYVASDRDATIEIFLRAIREVSFQDYNSDQINAWAQVVNREAWGERRASRSTWIASYSNHPAGFSDLDADGHLDMMFVHPEFQRVGVATALLRAVEGAALQRNLTLITVEASVTARPFFQSRGFVVVAPQEVAIRGQILINFHMEKKIGAAE